MLQPLIDGVLRQAARHSRSKPFAMRNTAPLVSFTFDDVPASAYSNGAAILEQYGLRGTFYIAAGTCGTMDRHWQVIDREQVRALYDRGHEIGCHTFSHVAADRLGALDMDEECGRNRTLLRALCPGIEVANFCYPFGRVSLPRKRQLKDRFDSCRGIYQGINAGSIDLAMLRVIELYDRTLTHSKLARVLRETRRAPWLADLLHARCRGAAELDWRIAALAARDDRSGSRRRHAMPADPRRARGHRLPAQNGSFIANQYPRRRLRSDEDAQYFWRLDEIAVPQPSWLLRQTERPFQTEPLQPARRPRLRPGQKIDRRPDAKRHAGFTAQFGELSRDHLLGRAADAQERDVPGAVHAGAGDRQPQFGVVRQRGRRGHDVEYQVWIGGAQRLPPCRAAGRRRESAWARPGS